MNTPETNSLQPVPVAGDFSDAKVRQKLRDELRAEEWAMHRELMAAARLVLKNFHDNPHKSTVADVGRILELSSKLGRLATESDSGFAPPEDGALVLVQFEAALKKVYARRGAEGKPVPPDAVVEVESTTTKSAPTQ